LESKYLYLAINLASLLIPFACSFYPRVPFVREWRFVIPAIAFTGLIFIGWDVLFTKWEVWGFNKRYLVGASFLGLPLEEILFFFCIPYACLFTYFAIRHLTKTEYLYSIRTPISLVLGLLLLVAGTLNLDKAYTATTFISTGLMVLWLGVWQRADYLGRFYFVFALLLIPFFIVNGALTGLFTSEPVVWYNDEENLGIRLLTIPIEDTAYALLMLLIPTALWEGFARRRAYRSRAPKRRTL